MCVSMLIWRPFTAISVLMTMRMTGRRIVIVGVSLTRTGLKKRVR